MEIDRKTRQALWVVFAGYLLLLGLSVFTDVPFADVGVEIAFIVIVLGFAWFSYREFGTEPLGLVASAALAGAAIGSAVALIVDVAAITITADILLLGGIALYLYLRWQQ